MEDLSNKRWKELIAETDDHIILDVRTSEEFEELRLPNSINIDFYNPKNFIQELEKLDKNKSYYVYCKTGNRSATTCDLMKEIGFTKTYNLLGGIAEWKGEVESQNK